MTSTQVRFDATGIGVWGDADAFEVTRDRIAAYAEATNDPIAAHRSGDVAPPVFAVVPAFMSMLQVAFVVAPPEVALRVVHGEQDFRYYRPIRPGDVITTRAKALGYRGAANGTSAAFLLECRDTDGALVNEQTMTAFFRGVDVGETVGELAPPHRLDDAVRADAPVAVVTQHVDDDQTFRYSPASGDPMPIHLDEDAAKQAGLPGIIAHGLCTQAFTSWAVLQAVAGGDSSRLRRHAVRFARPVLPGQDITTTIWRAGSCGGVTTYAFETTTGEGDAAQVVIKDGLAEITDEGAGDE
ncbi:MAG: MaoC/PaaZ C-terminal domain-containing protein [Jatrophihabitans sp.]|uniref:MaoC/PaaZ C-terminal domain-containing protein n=1 Tax=Jatrophihabitans sp. TaxID=1932789 RepID=UPI003F7E0BD6